MVSKCQKEKLCPPMLLQPEAVIPQPITSMVPTHVSASTQGVSASEGVSTGASSNASVSEVTTQCYQLLDRQFAPNQVGNQNNRRPQFSGSFPDWNKATFNLFETFFFCLSALLCGIQGKKYVIGSDDL
ncbi:unnamed protein product [Citrullus colocynthis]|uniref:Uncharacterized protein n=1 Tax=Citrullus colocynthis TaxID=252529 RepID=A0ABP0Y7W0_9ROSI